MWLYIKNDSTRSFKSRLLFLGGLVTRLKISITTMHTVLHVQEEEGQRKENRRRKGGGRKEKTDSQARDKGDGQHE